MQVRKQVVPLLLREAAGECRIDFTVSAKPADASLPASRTR
jgi:hypothetical protein